MDDSRVKDVSSLLSAFFDEEKLKRGEQYQKFFSSWTAVVGSRLAAHSRVADVNKGFLIVEADHPGWIQLLQFRQSEILEDVAKRFPQLGLKGIAFRLREKPGEKSDARSEDSVKRVYSAEDFDAATPVPDSPSPEPADSEGKGPASLDDPEFKELFSALKKAMQGKE
jgi:hypothetical protein